MHNLKSYFAGGNTPSGFVGYFNGIIKPQKAEHIYCIKGGPGVGKSTFMKKMAKELKEAGETVSLFYCPSDPTSLDAVLCDSKKIAFLDGTAPHTTDPVYPGACDSILDFGRFFDITALKKNKEEIVRVTDRVGELFSDAKNKLRPVGVIHENVKKLYEKYENQKKTERLCIELSDEIFGCRRGAGAEERKLFLSAITPDGNISFADKTLSGEKIFVLESYSGDLAHKIMSYIRNESLCREFYTECFYCPISPQTGVDHIRIPELDTVITVSNSYHTFRDDGKRYYTEECYTGKTDKESVSKAMENADEQIQRSVSILYSARELHSELEGFYKEAMDYEKLNRFTEKVINSVVIRHK